VLGVGGLEAMNTALITPARSADQQVGMHPVLVERLEHSGLRGSETRAA
jgi:hypothetical protein